MDTPLSSNPLTSGWMLFCGVVVVGAALKEAMARMSQIPHTVPAKRPSAENTIIIGLLLKHAVERIGSSATGTAAP
jgi:hypothetical protein